MAKQLPPLDPLLHSQLRLAIMSVVVNEGEADFNYLKEKTEATSGNLSVQINKLKDAGYVEVEKSFKNNYPLTTCKVTQQGVRAFEEYVHALEKYLKTDL
jgi:predicted transcriptional regulator